MMMKAIDIDCLSNRNSAPWTTLRLEFWGKDRVPKKKTTSLHLLFTFCHVGLRPFQSAVLYWYVPLTLCSVL